MSAINPKKLNSSTAAFLTALVVNFGLLTVEVGAFIVLKRKLWRVYSPRTVLPPPDKRAPELPPGPWKWIPVLLTSPLEDIIHKNGLDALVLMNRAVYMQLISIDLPVICFYVSSNF